MTHPVRHDLACRTRYACGVCAIIPLETALDRAGFTDVLEAKLPVLLEPEGEARLWISDNPVVRTNSFPYGDVGLASAGVEVYLPLAPDLMLGLLCPSIEGKLRAVRSGHLVLDAERRAPLVAFHDALLSGSPARCGDAAVDGFNRLQVSNSARFVYASRDDFDAAREIVRENPGLAHVTTQVRMGKLGEGPPRRSRMPDGLWMVLKGERDHHMLEIEDWDAAAEPIVASTHERGTLAAATADGPFVEVEVYEDGRSRRMTRDVVVEVLASGPPVRFRLVHRDPAMNQLLEAIASRRERRQAER